MSNHDQANPLHQLLTQQDAHRGVGLELANAAVLILQQANAHMEAAGDKRRFQVTVHEQPGNGIALPPGFRP